MMTFPCNRRKCYLILVTWFKYAKNLLMLVVWVPLRFISRGVPVLIVEKSWDTINCLKFCPTSCTEYGANFSRDRRDLELDSLSIFNQIVISIHAGKLKVVSVIVAKFLAPSDSNRKSESCIWMKSQLIGFLYFLILQRSKMLIEMCPNRTNLACWYKYLDAHKHINMPCIKVERCISIDSVKIDSVRSRSLLRNGNSR